MTEAELRDHAEDILTAIVHDISVAQTSEDSLASLRAAAPPRRAWAAGKSAFDW